MPTIRDVAKQAGVAPMTVSRVINNSGYVSEDTRTRVEEAISRLGYVPNMLGPSLRFNQTNTLALVLTDITNPFWTTVARGVEDAAQEAGYSVILCNTDESEAKQDQYLTMLLKRRIDGILLVPSTSTSNVVQTIKNQGVKVVVLDREVNDTEVDVVEGDSVGGAYQLTRYLIELGHQHIAILSGPQNVSTSSQRVAGFCRAIEEANLSHNTANIYWGEFSQTLGHEMVRRALQSTPRPTAFLAVNNFIANGALQALREMNIRVPEDVSVVSFDDIPVSINPMPFLTVAAQPAYEMGYQATQLLVARLVNAGPETVQKIILPVEILIRQSSGEPPQGPGNESWNTVS
ncbi:MAG: LacI family DNA-binding transcriptional regulator [Chloroflexi bacterium]|nr:LacI family DNA-binding transcriptional regulator [Chloroflexota bacterium]MBK8934334.1 LacI family DNA-binding transcriptional regulator [Chloroflexota bacterium]MBP7591443.1 LacI family DNA-binding transcriptional regulator [Chloroflexota bacterium]